MAHQQGIYMPPDHTGQQFYPNFIQPHPSSNAQHVPNQHYPSLSRPSSSFMPPPSTLPDDVSKWRNLQPQRPNNLWHRDVTEEQRQLQDRYPQNAQTPPINPYYAQQPTSSTAAAIAPSASYALPPGPQPGQFHRQYTQGPASTFPSAPTMTATSLPPASPARTESFTPAAASESTVQESRKPSAPQSVNTQQPMTTQAGAVQDSTQQPPAQSPTPAAPSPLEAARVAALLDINRLLLYSIFAIQTPPKTSNAPDPVDTLKLPQPVQPRPGYHTNPHYTDYMRRLQSNLAYLACVADSPHKPQNPVPPFPAIIATPVQRKPEASVEGDEGREKELRQKYDNLKELWPDWKGDAKKG